LLASSAVLGQRLAGLAVAVALVALAVACHGEPVAAARADGVLDREVRSAVAARAAARCRGAGSAVEAARCAGAACSEPAIHAPLACARGRVQVRVGPAAAAGRGAADARSADWTARAAKRSLDVVAVTARCRCAIRFGYQGVRQISKAVGALLFASGTRCSAGPAELVRRGEASRGTSCADTGCFEEESACWTAGAVGRGLGAGQATRVAPVDLGDRCIEEESSGVDPHAR